METILIICMIDTTLSYLGGLKNYSVVFLCINLSSGRLMWMWEEKNHLAKWFTSARRDNFHRTVKVVVRDLFVCFSDMSIAYVFSWVATRFLADILGFVCNRSHAQTFYASANTPTTKVYACRRMAWYNRVELPIRLWKHISEKFQDMMCLSAWHVPGEFMEELLEKVWNALQAMHCVGSRAIKSQRRHQDIMCLWILLLTDASCPWEGMLCSLVWLKNTVCELALLFTVILPHISLSAPV